MALRRRSAASTTAGQGRVDHGRARGTGSAAQGESAPADGARHLGKGYLSPNDFEQINQAKSEQPSAAAATTSALNPSALNRP